MQWTNSIRPTPPLRAEHDEAITLTSGECAALIELGLRPTYSLVTCEAQVSDVALMFANSALWMQAAEITIAGARGVVPPELREQVGALIEEALTDALRDLERLLTSRDAWRAGDGTQGFPELGADEIAALYEEYIEREREQLRALKSVAAKLHLSSGFSPDIYSAAPRDRGFVAFPGRISSWVFAGTLLLIVGVLAIF
jgi:hypothetical protein